jgi:hypothetical protein
MAHAEMRQMLAEMIWLFELKPDPGLENVMDGSKMFTLWKNLALAAWVKEVMRDWIIDEGRSIVVSIFLPKTCPRLTSSSCSRRL